MDNNRLFIFGNVLAGIFITIFYGMYGASNMYFAFGSNAVAAIWLMRCKLPWGRMVKKIIGVALLLSIIGFSHGYSNGYSHISMMTYLQKSYWLLVAGNPLVKADTSYSRDHVDREGYEAYEWLRNNTPQNCIIVTNRTTKILGAFAERYTNYPKFDNNIFSIKDKNEQKRVLAKYHLEGIQYIIVEPRYDDDIDALNKTINLLNNTCNIVYFSKNVIIYTVL